MSSRRSFAARHPKTRSGSFLPRPPSMYTNHSPISLSTSSFPPCAKDGWSQGLTCPLISAASVSTGGRRVIGALPWCFQSAGGGRPRPGLQILIARRSRSRPRMPVRPSCPPVGPNAQASGRTRQGCSISELCYSRCSTSTVASETGATTSANERKLDWVHQKIDHEPSGRVTLDELTYCRGDVQCTQDLLNCAKAEFDVYGLPDLLPDKAYSPASIGKAIYGRSASLRHLRNSTFPPSSRAFTCRPITAAGPNVISARRKCRSCGSTFSASTPAPTPSWQLGNPYCRQLVVPGGHGRGARPLREVTWANALSHRSGGSCGSSHWSSPRMTSSRCGHRSILGIVST